MEYHVIECIHKQDFDEQLNEMAFKGWILHSYHAVYAACVMYSAVMQRPTT